MAENDTTDDGAKELPPPEMMAEWGVDTFGSSVRLVNFAENTMLINKPAVTIDQLTDMRRRDGQAKALIQLVTLPLRLALSSGTWVGADGEDDESDEVKFANLVWSLPPAAGGMSTPKNKIIRQMLLSLVDGFSAFELVLSYADKGPLQGKYYLKKIAYRDPSTIKFMVDKQGGYRGFRQQATDALGNPIDVSIPVYKSFTITQHDELNPFYGVSLFESAYPHFDAKRKLYYIAHMAAQFAALPARVGEVPFGAKASDVQAFNRALANLSFNGAMSAPTGFKVTNLNGNSGFDFIKLIDHHNHMMSKSILAPFFDQENRTVLVDSGAGQDSDMDLFLNSMETFANDIAEDLTHYLMPSLIDFNFGTDNYPVFKPGQLSDTARKMIRDMFNTIVSSAVINATPEFVRQLEINVSKEAGLDIDYDEIARQEKEAAEQKAQADEEAARAQQQIQLQQVNGQQLQDSSNAPGGTDASGGSEPAPTSPTGTKLSNPIDELVKAAESLFMPFSEDTAPIDDIQHVAEVGEND